MKVDGEEPVTPVPKPGCMPVSWTEDVDKGDNIKLVTRIVATLWPVLEVSEEYCRGIGDDLPFT